MLLDHDTQNVKELTTLVERVLKIKEGLEVRHFPTDEAILLCLQQMARTLDRIKNELKMLRKEK